MAVTEADFEKAKALALAEREAVYIQVAQYNRRRERVIVHLSTGVEVTFPVALAEGLAGAPHEDLAVIEISPTGLELHWPRLDADLYVQALLQGAFGSRNWMASHMGAAGEKAAHRPRSQRPGKGPKGGRPRRTPNG